MKNYNYGTKEETPKRYKNNTICDTELYFSILDMYAYVTTSALSNQIVIE